MDVIWLVVAIIALGVMISVSRDNSPGLTVLLLILIVTLLIWIGYAASLPAIESEEILSLTTIEFPGGRSAQVVLYRGESNIRAHRFDFTLPADTKIAHRICAAGPYHGLYFVKTHTFRVVE